MAYRMMGVYLQASLLTSALFSVVVVSLLWFYSEPVVVFLRQDPGRRCPIWPARKISADTSVDIFLDNTIGRISLCKDYLLTTNA